MLQKLLRSKNVHALVMAYVLIAASLVLLVQAHGAAAAGATNDTLVVGLQSDMTNPNIYDPATNSVWKQYQTEYNFEGLVFHDPAYQSYNVLSDPTHTSCPTGTVLATGYPGGICIDTATGLQVTVFLRTNVTFTNGQPLTADDVVFTYQHDPWGVGQNTGTLASIWWTAPKWPLWNSTTYGGTCSGPKCMSHVGIEKLGTYEVRFNLAQPYSLFFFDPMEFVIIPSGVWKTHLAPYPSLNLSDPAHDLTDSFDVSLDTSWSGIDAAIGTGPFMLTSWTHNQGSTLDIYTSYWGKGQTHVWAGTTFQFYPAYLRHIRTVIYGSLDVISLALQKGDIDTLVWTLTPGFLTQIQSNPQISVEQVTDSGFFYLAWNLRERPWGGAPWSLTLRTAMSKAINKDYIVNTLLGGFGTKGTVPIGISNPLYVNQTASPPAFDITGGHNDLIAAGFKDCNGDGFLEAPDCSVIKATILTPPKDYDPTRADAGIMISNNLKTMGLNINSAPTDFNTISAKAFGAPVSFDLYILGWSLGDFPETYLCSFYCTNQDVNLGTGGSNSPGYSNTKVDTLIGQIQTETDTATRVQKVMDVEGILTHDLPWNVLYYRKNLNAYRNDRWVGWENYPNGGGLYNVWSIFHIAPAGTAVPPPSGALTVALNMPNQVYARENVPMGLVVAQGTAPAAGVAYNVTLSYGSKAAYFTGTTDASGKGTFAWTVPVIQGNVLVSARVTKGTVTGTNGKVMEVTVGPPAPTAQLNLSTPKPVISPTDTTTVTATLVDGAGTPIVGSKVELDTTLVLGTFNKKNDTTDTNGQVTFTYTPPSTTKYPNTHLTEIIKASASVPSTIVGDTQSASLVLFVQNDVTPMWNILNVTATDLNGPVLNTVTTSAHLTVTAVDWTGAPVAGLNIDPQYTDVANVTVAPAPAGANKTDANGHAFFVASKTLAAIAGNNATNVGLRFAARDQAFATTNMVELLVANATSTGYGALVTFGSWTLPYSAAGTRDSVVAHVWDQAGVPAPNVPVVYQIDYGDLGVPAQFDFGFDYNTGLYTGPGLDLNSFGGSPLAGSIGGNFQSSVGEGAGFGADNFINDWEVLGWAPNTAVGHFLDACNPAGSAKDDVAPWPAGFTGTYTINATSRTDATGVVSANFTALPAKVDTAMQVRAYIGATDVSVDACNYVSSVENSAFRVDAGVVIQRAPLLALASVHYSKPILTSQGLSIGISALFKGLGGAISKPQVMLVQGAGSAARNVLGAAGGPMLGTTHGYVNYTRTVSLLSLSQAFSFSFVPADLRYAYGGTDQMFNGATPYYWNAPTSAALLAKIPFEFKVAYLYLPTTTAFLTVSLDQTLLAPGGTATASVHVWSVLTGNPIAGANVWSGSVQNTTDSTGKATLPVTAATLGATEGLVVATTAYGGAARGWYALVASPPVVTYGTPTVTPKTAGTASTITATVTNTLAVAGPVTVWLYVDNASVASQVVNLTASQSTTVTFNYVFPTSGSRYVTVGDQSTTTSIPAPVVTAADNTVLYALAAGLLVVGLVVGVLVGMMLARRGRRPPAAEDMSDEPTGGEGKAEEELPPEDKL